MNKYFYLPLILIGIIGIYVCTHQITERVNVYTGTTFFIPAQVRNLALLGCTPQPSIYLQNKDNRRFLSSIKLNKLLDIDYLKDSFEQTITLCKHNSVDHLLIAYLPIYFSDIKQSNPETFIDDCTTFLENIAPQIKTLIEEIMKTMDYSIPVTIILPTRKELEKVPSGRMTNKQRIQFLIKQFPQLINLNTSDLRIITIINNKNSDQNEEIINYFEYEYLFNKPIEYSILSTDKEKFHKYL